MTITADVLVDTMKEEYDEMLRLFQRSLSNMMDVMRTVREDPKVSNEDMVDVGFFMREIGKVADEIRKEADAKSRYIGRQVAVDVGRRSLQGEEIDPTIRGRFARGETDVKVIPILPKPGTPEYVKLCDFLDVPDHMRQGHEEQSSPFKFSFRGLEELAVRRLEAGEELPDGLELHGQEMFTKFVKNR